MNAPPRKVINDRLAVSVAQEGWPYWTNVEIDRLRVGLDREEAHSLLHAMQRICEYLVLREDEDHERHLRKSARAIMSKAYKVQAVETNVGSAISDAFGEIESLRDEMQEACDNMENANTGLATTEKFNRMSEARDSLDNHAGNEPDVPSEAEGLALTVNLQVSTRKGRGASRSVRLANAVACLEAAKDALDTAADLERASAKDSEGEADDYDRDAEDARNEEPPNDEACSDAERNAVQARDSASNAESNAEAFETLRDELENIIGDVEGVEFPGFYG